MFPKEAELNNLLAALYLKVDHETVNQIAKKTQEALSERSMQAQKVLELQLYLEKNFPNEMQTGKHVVDIAKKLLCDKLELTPEEVNVNQRLLFLIHKEFTCHYKSFDGDFGEWLELRGLAFEKDRFIPVYNENRIPS